MNARGDRAGAACRIFDSLLMLYPKPFQDEFAEEMHDVFVEGMREQRAHSRAALFFACIRETAIFALIGVSAALFLGLGSKAGRRRILLIVSGCAAGGRLATLLLQRGFAIAVASLHLTQVPRFVGIALQAAAAMIVGAFAGLAVGAARLGLRKALPMAVTGCLGFGIANIVNAIAYTLVRLIVSSHSAVVGYSISSLSAMCTGILDGALLGFMLGRREKIKSSI
jgi:hypothetical protein